MCSRIDAPVAFSKWAIRPRALSFLTLDVVLRLDARPGLGSVQRGEGHDRRAGRRGVGKGVVQAGRRLALGGIQRLEALVYVVRVRVGEDEVAVFVEPQLLRRRVQPQIHDQSTRRESSGIAFPMSDLRYGRPGRNQTVVDQSRGSIRNHVLRGDPLAARRDDPRNATVFHQDLIHPGVEPRVSPELPDSGFDRRRELVRTVPGNVAAESDELGHHSGEYGEVQPAGRRAQIHPGRVEDRLRLLGHFERIGDPIDAVGGGLQEVGVLRGEDLPIGVAPRLAEVGQGIHDLHAQIDVVGDGFPRARNFLLDGVDVVLHAVAQGDVQLFTGIGHDHAKGFRYLHPVQVDAELILEKRPHATLVVGRSHVGDQVHGGLELESSPHEAAGKAARNIVLLQEQHLHVLGRQLRRGSEATVSRADHDAVVRAIGSHS